MAPESSTLKKGARVVVIDDLPGVSAGTAGKVGRSIGIKAVRYRVQFENGVNALSVAESKLVSPAAWEFIKENRVSVVQNGSTPTVATAVPVAASQGSVDPVSPPRTITEPPPVKKGSQSEPETPSGTSGEDPRLAALTAKSRDARKAAGVDVDAEATSSDAPAEDVASSQQEDDASGLPATTTPESSSPASPMPVPDGYFPTDNRIADLLASIKKG